jgi:hypothetical protein
MLVVFAAPLAFAQPAQTTVLDYANDAVYTPWGIDVDAGGNLFVTNYLYANALRFSPAGGGTYAAAGTVSNSATLSYPVGLRLDASGNVFVADSGNNVVRKFAPDGNGAYTLAATIGSGVLSGPYGVAVDSFGNVFVADTGNFAIRLFQPSGADYVQGPDVVAPPSAYGGYYYDVAVDAEGNVYGAHTYFDVVEEFRPNAFGGGYQATPVSLPVGGNVYCVSVDARGDLYACDHSNNAVVKFTPDGSGGFDSPVAMGIGLTNVSGAAADRQQNVYVTETNTNTGTAAVVRIGDRVFGGDFEDPHPPGWAVQCSGTKGYQDYFIENFPGSSLDAGRWTVHQNAGTVSVTGNSVTLASDSGSTFPYVTSVGSPIPASGNFSVRWTATYANVADYGDGALVLATGLPTNGSGDESGILRLAEVWQDSSGYVVKARGNSTDYQTLLTEYPATLGVHDVEYCWLQDSIEVWVDGVRHYQAARDSGLPRPTSLWFGNPVDTGAAGSWNDFTLNYVHVRSLSP